MSPVVVGIDIGGTNTPFGILTENGEVLKEGKISTKNYPNIEDFVDALCKEILMVLSNKDLLIGLKAVGIGAPNGNFYNGTIDHAPNLVWKGIVPLAEMIKEQLKVPVFVTNDANAAAVGELLYGEGKGMRNIIEVTLGTGLGSGFIANGELLYGHHSYGGELGHTIIMPNGRQCNCGRKGCLETYTSVTGLIRTAVELKTKYPMSSLNKVYELELNGEHIMDAAKNKDELALETYRYTAEVLAIGLSNAAAISNPEAIILFGGMTKAGDLLMKPLRKYFEENLLNILKGKTKLLISSLKDKNAAIVGAGAIAWNQINQ